ncbi:MAG TPA: GntR family transcriptional regulator [Solirubrobacteraceae bacterium]|nr:GntR family transcriptional regulator [Solirubrobacteraceae bacterium]
MSVTDAPRELAVASVVDLAYAAIRERIVAGELARGERLHQEDLAVELGVSRTPVREALRRLAAEGLVEMRTNRGARVADLDRTGMRAAYEARLVIEPGAARLAATLGLEEPLRAMGAALERQRRLGGGVHARFEANRDFHLALVAAAGNQFLEQVARVLWVSRIGEAIYEAQAATRERMRLDADEHAAILEAVQRGDARSAETLTRRHLAAAIKRSAL